MLAPEAAPWWAIPAAVWAGSLVGGYVVTNLVKLAIRDLRKGRKPPNLVSITLAALITGGLGALLAWLTGYGARELAFIALATGLPAPILVPALVLAAATLAEARAPGMGEKVRDVLLGREQERRRPRTAPFPGHERRARDEDDDDRTIIDRTRTWLRG